jgi:uncharacterized protein with FMN-binding domain
MLKWIIILIIAAIVGTGGTIGWSYLSKEHNEARNVSLHSVDFSKLNDGTYAGEYEGGMYKWRANKVQVTVVSGKVTDIKLLSSSEDPSGKKTVHTLLFKQVIKSQSFPIDGISGATLTSKAYLKAVENALDRAQ